MLNLLKYKPNKNEKAYDKEWFALGQVLGVIIFLLLLILWRAW